MPARIPMTARQRAALLALPDTEALVLRYHTLDAADLAAAARARTPGTRLAYALQLCALRYPGRHLRRGDVLPAAMLDHVAEQVGAGPDEVAAFARRPATRYDQLEAIKRAHGFRDLTRPLRGELSRWLTAEAVAATDGRRLLDALVARMRSERIVIPGASVVERLAAEAMHAADLEVTAMVHALVPKAAREALDTLLSDKAHPMRSRLSWLREPPGRVGATGLGEMLDRLDLVRATGVTGIAIPDACGPRLGQMAREGVRLTAQAFQQMGAARRHVALLATVRALEATLADGALTMFGQMVARANLRARKRAEGQAALAEEHGRDRLARVAGVLEALARAAKAGRDPVPAVLAVAPLDQVEADAALLRRSLRPGRPDALPELAAEHRAFRQVGPRFLASFPFQGHPPTAALRAALRLLAAVGGDGRRPLPADAPLAHLRHRWRRHVVAGTGLDRTYWELGTYFAVADALASGDLWVEASRLHRSLGALIAPGGMPAPASGTMPDPDHWLAWAQGELDAALLRAARGLDHADPRLFSGDRLRFPRDPADEPGGDNAAKGLATRAYGAIPTTRITDVLSQVARWTGFDAHFTHLSTGLPPADGQALLAALIAEATNLGLARMAEACGTVSRRAMLRVQTWHMREETFRAALACLTDAIHAEPLSTWFGEGTRASADGQAFQMGGPGKADGQVNAHYGRDPVVKVYTTVTDRYAPLHQTVIAGTAGEAAHALDGILGHASGFEVAAFHADGGGVSDMVFALTHLLGISFEPRIPRLSDRRLYAFEPASRYGRLAPLFGRRLDADLVQDHWEEVGHLVGALRARAVTPSLVLRKLSAYRQQNGVAAALREIGRVQRTLFTLRWFSSPGLRRLVTAELNKGEARNSLARVVAFHRLGRFRDRGHENQQLRAAALTLVTAAIILFNCRYLGHVLREMRARGMPVDDKLVPQLSPLGWDHINLTGDYVWSDALGLDADGFLPLRMPPAALP